MSADCVTHSVVPAIKRQRIDTPDRSCQVLHVSVTGTPLCQLTLMKMYATRMFCFLKGSFKFRLSVTQSLVQLDSRTYKWNIFHWDCCGLAR